MRGLVYNGRVLLSLKSPLYNGAFGRGPPFRRSRLAARCLPMIDVRYILFSDLDGTLLDAKTYGFAGAEPALAALGSTESFPLILMTSKTAEETLGYVRALETGESFSVENGGGIYIAKHRVAVPPPGSIADGAYHRLDQGAPIERLSAFLLEFNHRYGTAIRALTDLTVDEAASATGLAPEEAARALRRAFDLPLLLPPGAESALDDLRAEAEAAGLTIVDGGLFPHLKGPSDKGSAFDLLLPHYRGPGGTRTVALGDSANDGPMLTKADVAVLIPRSDGSWDARLAGAAPESSPCAASGPGRLGGGGSRHHRKGEVNHVRLLPGTRHHHAPHPRRSGLRQDRGRARTVRADRPHHGRHPGPSQRFRPAGHEAHPGGLPGRPIRRADHRGARRGHGPGDGGGQGGAGRSSPSLRPALDGQPEAEEALHPAGERRPLARPRRQGQVLLDLFRPGLGARRHEDPGSARLRHQDLPQGDAGPAHLSGGQSEPDLPLLQGILCPLHPEAPRPRDPALRPAPVQGHRERHRPAPVHPLPQRLPLSRWPASSPWTST